MRFIASHNLLRSGVLTAATAKITVFWNVKSYSLIEFCRPQPASNTMVASPRPASNTSVAPPRPASNTSGRATISQPPHCGKGLTSSWQCGHGGFYWKTLSLDRKQASHCCYWIPRQSSYGAKFSSGLLPSSNSTLYHSRPKYWTGQHRLNRSIFFLISLQKLYCGISPAPLG
jgi:hypothetical protein